VVVVVEEGEGRSGDSAIERAGQRYSGRSGARPNASTGTSGTSGDIGGTATITATITV
jgi:hypothetical protein